ncbi:MAG: hypothetical protein N3G20_04190 [Verrucomicrobiae bacterium]|nr:hypothetical protein [Verrucomicrobiae bacterium]
MNENHKRHLVAVFRRIDKLLSEAERVLVTADSASPFNEYVQDSTPVQRKVVHDCIERIRGIMARTMTELGLPKPGRGTSAVWGARGYVGFAIIQVAEMEPKRMTGYGTLSWEDCEAINRLVQELNAALEDLAGYLEQGSREV